MTRTEPPFTDAGKNRQNDDPTLERKLWAILQREVSTPDQLVPLTRYGCRELDAQKKQLVDIVARWRNHGLVQTFESDTNVRLTATGRRVDDPTAPTNH